MRTPHEAPSRSLSNLLVMAANSARYSKYITAGVQQPKLMPAPYILEWQLNEPYSMPHILLPTSLVSTPCGTLLPRPHFPDVSQKHNYDDRYDSPLRESKAWYMSTGTVSSARWIVMEIMGSGADSGIHSLFRNPIDEVIKLIHGKDLLIVVC